MSVQLKAVSAVKHDEVLYEANDVFSVEDDQAEALVEAGAATYVDKQTPKKGGTPAESKRLDKNPKEAARVKAEADAAAKAAGNSGDDASDQVSGQSAGNAGGNSADVPNIEWSRAQLDDHARTLGIEPADMPNKQAVLDAIEKAGA